MTFREFIEEEKQPYSDWMIDALYHNTKEDYLIKLMYAFLRIKSTDQRQ